MGANTHYGYTDWSTIATKLGHGMTHRQCSTRWREMVRSHKRSLHITRLMTGRGKGDLCMNLEPEPITTVSMQSPTAEGVSTEIPFPPHRPSPSTSSSAAASSSSTAAAPSSSASSSSSGHIRYDCDADIERAFRKQGRRKGPEGIKTNWTPAMVRPDHVLIYVMLVSPCELGIMCYYAILVDV